MYGVASHSLAVSVPNLTLMASASGQAGGIAAALARYASAAPRPVAHAAVAAVAAAAAAVAAAALKTGWC